MISASGVKDGKELRSPKVQEEGKDGARRRRPDVALAARDEDERAEHEDDRGQRVGEPEAACADETRAIILPFARMPPATSCLPAERVDPDRQLHPRGTGLEYAFTKAPRNKRSLVMSVFLLTSAMSTALGEAFASLSTDPLLVWNYSSTGMGVLSMVAGILF
ncbi:hypothetical protein FB451DRAFT_1412621 [Mycena latifolia]|nr:hypothetical protein FB451DRAFT_1412621 [Mycena latifolia]